jgi:UDP-glucose 4-epimerase
MINNRRVFITGGAGFIGSAVADRLLDSNSVTLFDNLHRGTFDNRRVADNPQVRLIRGDILDTGALAAAIADHDIIIHCAAIAGIDSVADNPVSTMLTNMIGSANVFQAALEFTEAKVVICLTTSEVFGPQASNVDETSPGIVGPPGEPRWTYAAGKLAEEHLALAYHRQHRLPVVVLRPFNVYGPGQIGEGAVRNFIIQALANEDLILSGGGGQIRSWCYIDDMVDAVIRAASTPAALGKTFNIGNANTVVSVSELAKLIVDLSGSRSMILDGPASNADIHVRSPCVDLARKLLGFEAGVGLNEGLLRTIEHAGLATK